MSLLKRYSTSKEPQQDGRRGNCDIIKSHTPQVGRPQIGKQLYCRSSLPGVRSMTHISLPSLGVWYQEEESPEHFSLKASMVWLQELHWSGGKRKSILGGHIQGFTYTGTTTMQWLHSSLNHTYLLFLQGIMEKPETTVAVRARILVPEVPGNIHWHELSWRPPFWHQGLAPPQSL